MEAINKEQSVPGPAIHSFNCPGCGGAVQVRAFGQSIAVVCQFCGSVLDPSDKNVKILQKAEAAITRKPIIPIGKRGMMEGKEWEVVGFMVRSVPRWNYEWEEYLLFNPWYGFRFLVQSEGHWSWIKTLTHLPSGQETKIKDLKFEGGAYNLYSSEEVRVEFVLGEFFWRVKRGDKVPVLDFVDPPYILSVEKDPNGIVWSKGEYIEADEIKKTFGNDLQLPAKNGIAPNQPSSLKKSLKTSFRIFLVFAAILTAAQVYFLATATNKEILRKSFSPIDSVSREMTIDFSLPAKVNNLSLNFQFQLNNNWCYIEGNLYEKNTGANYPFDFTSEYYSGVEDGSSWSEGSNKKEIFMNRIPPGEYYLNMELESDSPFKFPAFELEIKQDVPLFSNFIILVALMLVPLLILLILSGSFEYKRWKDSGYSPYNSGEDDE